MAETTGIAWTNSTLNPWIGCTKVGPGCDHCYAEVSTPSRTMGIKWGAGQTRRRTSNQVWNQPHKWNKAREIAMNAYALGRGPKPLPHRVFCASLADVFDNEVDWRWRIELWALIRACPYLTWQLVTKRVGNVMKMVPHEWLSNWPENVWIIATVVNQDEFDRDWPKLREIPAVVRGLSIEPMLGPITFPQDVRDLLHWAIYGGESKQGGAEARPCEVLWIESGVEQCRQLGIAPFVKQLGHGATAHGIPLLWGTGKRADPTEWYETIQVQEFPK